MEKPFDNNKLNYETYNGFRFTKISEGWQTLVEMNDQLYEVPFYNHPLDLQDFPYDDEVTKYLEEVIITIQPRRNITIAVHPESGSTPAGVCEPIGEKRPPPSKALRTNDAIA